ncbi:two-component system sensor histidine kinase DcuS [Sporosarcina sp. P21c]|uniref:DcuS/MalK family sensor histidine kinase n=1 Tax=unclassified Sporosarcina TaxID=2647733 RepID=UPI000C162EA8|nr:MULTISPECIES: DcuS/MalK family sensor histidine kinase [unclassified Sporosarcina]PIC67243.1 two-component system sensor histidine kinase DcuS [Sporosarcina sp. P16a]PIC90180.1 two-component system sensor histidine kinase DcuS [Sporosarcina sp. P21c]PIC92695.1 two-component system sensor histidine kinase DcuS [Sporosarcina sp. P25]
MKKLNKKPISMQVWLTALVCMVVLVSLSVAGYLIGSNAADQARISQSEKAMNIAVTISHAQSVIDGLTGKGPIEDIQTFTKSVQNDTQVEYIVVMNNERIRLSHPVAERIGQYFVGGDEDKAFAGEQYTSMATGTLGKSMRAFVPIMSEGQIIGVVAVGIMMDNVRTSVLASINASFIGIGFGLLIGLFGAILLAKKVKRTLFGLEPREIAQQLRERESMLEAVSDGIVAINDKAEIVLVNQAAITLFRNAGVGGNPVGKPIQSFIPSLPLQQMLEHKKPQYDQELKLNGLDVVVTQVPVISNDSLVGALAIFRNKSELTSLVEQLSGARVYAETLRYQTHEFMNKLHIIMAMVHTKSYDELKMYTAYISDAYQTETGIVSRLVKDPVIAGYLMSKLSELRDSGIKIKLHGDHPLPPLKKVEHMDKIITILGNLIDNACEAVSDRVDGELQLTLNYEESRLEFSVYDNGPGILVENIEEVFEQGMSSKGEGRGYGLYLAKIALDELDGIWSISSTKGKGTQFIVSVPYKGEES